MLGGLAGAIAAGLIALIASWLITRASGMRPLVAIALAAGVVLLLAVVVLAVLVALSRP